MGQPRRHLAAASCVAGLALPPTATAGYDPPRCLMSARSDPQNQLTESFMFSREVRLAAQLLLPLVAGGLLLLTGCPGETPQAKKAGTTSAHADDDHDHD